MVNTQYQQNKQPPPTSNHWVQKWQWHNTDRNLGLGLGQAQKCGGVKLVNGIQLVYIVWKFPTIYIHVHIRVTCGC
jgi:hypothetical protein